MCVNAVGHIFVKIPNLQSYYSDKIIDKGMEFRKLVLNPYQIPWRSHKRGSYRSLMRRCPGLFFSIFILLSACTQPINTESLDGGLGLNLSILDGNNQVAKANHVFKKKLSVQLTDTKGKPAPGIPVEFNFDESLEGAGIIQTNSTTDGKGLIEVQVKAPSFASTKFTVTAHLPETKLSQIFHLETDKFLDNERFEINTTHDLTETAGIPFGFTVTLVKGDGNIDTRFNQKQILIWQIQSSPSWTGAEPTLPFGKIECQFIEGLCKTEDHTILTNVTSDAEKTLIWVGADEAGVLPVSALEIKVLPLNTSKKVVFADKLGGPLQESIALTPKNGFRRFVFNALDNPSGLFAAITDSSGNYLSDGGPDVTWSLGGIVPLESALSSMTGGSVLFSPEHTGISTLTVSAVDSESSSMPFMVNPGPPVSLEVKTANQDTGGEKAGEPIDLTLRALDAKGNTVINRYDNQLGGYTGIFNVLVSLENHTSGKKMSGGCNRILDRGHGEDFWMGSGTSGGPGSWDAHDCPSTRELNVNFVQGVSSQQIQVILNEAPMNPRIKINSVAGNGFSTIEGNSGIFKLNESKQYHLNLRNGLGSDTEYKCSIYYLANSLECPAFIVTTGSTPQFVVVAVEDSGGNWISNPNASFSFGGAWYRDWSGAFPANQSTFTPTVAGLGTLTLSTLSSGSIPAISTTIMGRTLFDGIKRYTIEASDGLNAINTLSVLRSHELKISALDTYGNLVETTPETSLSILYDGAHDSPKGTPKVVPEKSTIANFIGGVARVSLGEGGAPLRLPNATDQISITVTDGTATSTPLRPALKIGPRSIVKIRGAATDGSGSGDNNTGADLTGQTINMTTDNPVKFYIATYDSELNYYTDHPRATWGGSIKSLGTLISPAVETIFTPKNLGTGILEAHVDGFDPVSTGEVTIIPGTQRKFVVTTSSGNAVTAGQSFDLLIRIEDLLGNLVVSDNKIINLNISFQTQKSWTGIGATLPADPYSCEFKKGICTIPGVILTNSLDISHVSIGDGMGGYSDVVNHEIQVQPGVADRIVMTKKSGGPAGDDHIQGTEDDAVPINNQIVFTADDDTAMTQAARTFWAAEVDITGNYLGEAELTQWRIEDSNGNLLNLNPNLNESLQTATGKTTVIIPKVAGAGFLVAQKTPLKTATLPFFIDPGVIDHFELTTEHASVEIAGEPFTLQITAKDRNNNICKSKFSDGTGAYSGNKVITLTLSGEATSGSISNGIGRFITDRSIISDESHPLSYSFSQNFIEGISSGTVYGLLNKASSSTDPKSATAVLAVSSSGITGMAPEIKVNQGLPHHLNLRLSPNDDSTYVCKSWEVNALAGDSAIQCSQLIQTAGDPAKTYFTVVEDKGGNLLDLSTYGTQNPITASWTFEEAFIDPAQWTTPDTTSKRFTPRIAGTGGFTLTYSSPNSDLNFSNYFEGMTKPGPLAKYLLTIQDTMGSGINTLVATAKYTLKIESYDSQNNYLNNEDRSVTLSYIGQTIAPDGVTAPVIPPNTIKLNHGRAIISDLQLPNASNQVRIIASSDGETIQSTYSLLVPAPSPLRPSIIPGTATTARIRSAPDNSGFTTASTDPYNCNDATSQCAGILTTTADRPVIFYAAVYDSLFNYIPLESKGSWSSPTLLAKNATFSSIGSSTRVIPSEVGSGLSLTLTPGGVISPASTAPITITHGALHHFVLSSSKTSVLTGEPFAVTVTLKDSKDNTLTSDSSSYPLTINILNLITGSYPNSGQTYSFTNGVLANQLFNLTSVNGTPTIQYSTQSGSISGSINISVTTPASAYKVSFITSPQTVIAGICSARLQIQAQDSDSKSVNVPVMTEVKLTPDGNDNVKFYSNSSCTIPITTNKVTIGANRNTTPSFYFLTNQSGKFTLKALATLITVGASQDETVNPSVADATQSSISANPSSGLIANGSTYSTITIILKDRFGNPIRGNIPILTSTGLGLNIFSPTSTDDTGMSTARVSSLTSGTKTIQIQSPSSVSTLKTTVTFLDGANLGFVRDGVNAPLDPADYDTDPTLLNTTRDYSSTITYVLRNTGEISSTPISISVKDNDGTDASKWWEIHDNDCVDANGNGLQLAPNESCNLKVRFLAGKADQMAGIYNAILTAYSTNGGTAEHHLKGTASYQWLATGHHIGSISGGYEYDLNTEVTGSCQMKGTVVRKQIATNSSGTHYLYSVSPTNPAVYLASQLGFCAQTTQYPTETSRIAVAWDVTTLPNQTEFWGGYFEFDNMATNIALNESHSCDISHTEIIEIYSCN